jgi:hypothetical protein
MLRKLCPLLFAAVLYCVPAKAQTNQQPATLTLPLASKAIITSLIGNGTTMTAICNGPCGMPVGTSNFTVTNIVPTTCNGAGPNIVTMAVGDLVSWSSTCIINAAGQAGNFTQVNAPVLVLNNSGFSGNAVQMLLDYDSHLTEAMTSNGSIKSDLDLDVSGIAGLVNHVAQQAAYLDASGEFCVGDLTPQTACATTAWGNHSYGGALTKYQGLSPISGNGQPFIVYGNKAVPLNGDVPPTTLVTTPLIGYGSNDLYTMRVYAVATTGIANSTCQLNLLYIDVTGAQTQTTAQVSFGTAAAKIAAAPFVFAPAPGTPIQISATTTNSPEYKLWIEIEVD